MGWWKNINKYSVKCYFKVTPQRLLVLRVLQSLVERLLYRLDDDSWKIPAAKIAKIPAAIDAVELNVLDLLLQFRCRSRASQHGLIFPSQLGAGETEADLAADVALLVARSLHQCH